jgi:hypothetical protein
MKIDIPPFPTFYESLHPLVQAVADLVGSTNAEYRKQIIEHSLYAFARRIFILPASEGHHDADAGGLARHSLRVARLALERFAASHDDYRDRLALLVVAIQHDVGKQYHVRVTAPGENGEIEWQPHLKSLATWCEEHHLTQVDVTWKEGRPQVGPSSIESIGNFTALRVWPEAIVPLLGPGRINSIQSALTTAIGVPRLDLFTPFKQADRADTGQFRDDSADFGARFYAALAGLLATADDINAEDASAYLSATHALVVLPRERVQADGLRSLARDAGIWRQALSLTDPLCSTAEDVLAATVRLLADPALPWLGEASDAGMADARQFRIGYTSGQDHQTITKRVAIIPVSALFSQGRPAALAFPWDVGITIVRNSGKPCLATPSGLGFKAWTAPSLQNDDEKGRAPDPASSTNPEQRRLAAAEDITAIWRRLVPIDKRLPILVADVEAHGRISPANAYSALANIREHLPPESKERSP